MGKAGASSGRRWSALVVTKSLVLPLSELEWRSTPPGGPGGQHANRRSTKVEVAFDVARSSALGPRQRARLLARLGPVVRASAGEQRSQARNREVALERLARRLEEALRLPPRRRPTQPSPAARERRLREKQARGERKRARRLPAEDF